MENELPPKEVPLTELPGEMQELDDNTTDEDILESQSDLSDAYEDMVNAIDEIGELQIVINDGVESADTLEDVGDVLADKLNENEGISDSAVMATEVVLESIRVRLGFPKTFAQIPSLESFKADNKRVESTRIALESTIKSRLHDIWDKIIAFIKNIMAKVLMFIKNLIQNYDRLEKHLTKLKDKVQSLPDVSKTPVGELSIHPTLIKFFSYKGKADFDTVKHSIETVAKFNGLIEKSVKVFSEIDFANFSKMDLDGLKDQIQKHGEKFSFIFNPINNWVPGNQKITYEIVNDKARLRLVDLSDTAKSLMPLTKQQCLTILEMAIKQTKTGNNIREIGQEVKQSMEKFIKQIEKVSANDEDKAMASKIKDFMHKNVTALLFVSTKLPSIHFKTLKYVGDYAALTYYDAHRHKSNET